MKTFNSLKTFLCMAVCFGLWSCQQKSEVVSQELTFNQKINALEGQSKVVRLDSLTSTPWKAVCYIAPYTSDLSASAKRYSFVPQQVMPDDVETHIYNEGSAIWLIQDNQQIFLKIKNPKLINDTQWLKKSPKLISQLQEPQAISESCFLGSEVYAQSLVGENGVTHLVFFNK